MDRFVAALATRFPDLHAGHAAALTAQAEAAVTADRAWRQAEAGASTADLAERLARTDLVRHLRNEQVEAGATSRPSIAPSRVLATPARW